VDSYSERIVLIHFLFSGIGVRDFFYEPAKGIVVSPKEFGTGLARVNRVAILFSLSFQIKISVSRMLI
jgi:hypothetical protein